MKVCCINPPWEQDGRWGIRAGCRFPNLMPRAHNSYVPFPFLLAYTAAYLEQQGVEVLIIDGVAERCSMASLQERLIAFAPELLIAETATTSLANDLQILAALKVRLSNTYIALYGPHVSVLPQEGMAACVDFVIRGEPELTAHELMLGMAGQRAYADIQGLVYRDADGQVQINPRRPLLQEVDRLPFPLRDGMPLDRYSVPGFPSPVVFMYGSRGCPFRCNYCLWPQTLFEKGSYRPRAPEMIVAEMCEVLQRYPQTRSFFFDDDTFNLGRDRLLRFADELERQGVIIPWGMNARADNWDRELLERLKATGMFTLRIGIESGDQRVLDRCNKSLNLENARRMLQLSDSLGISNHVSFMIGLAGETWDSVENTIRYINTLPVASVQFSVAVPFPGTDYFRYVDEHDLLVTRDWTLYSGSENAVMRTEEMNAEEVRRAVIHARRRIYFSPRFIKRRLRYVRDQRDLLAMLRKVARLLTIRS
jgi:anaerobic magnesium-protoporphyrin IX monomethyl ester cyclase